MSEKHNQRGRHEAPRRMNPLALWWGQHREWVAGLSRGAKIRYRLFQVLVVAAVLIIALYLFLRSWIKLPEVPDLPGINTNPGGNTSQQGEPGPDDVSFEGAELPDVAKSGRKPGYYTFLLCGKDVVSNSTDTMILVTYDTKGKTINAVSLLRDTMTNTSAKRGAQKRLNTVYTRNLGDRSLPDKTRIENGMAGLKKEVSKLTGIYPDFYVVVEWEAIGNLVNAVGGVEFEVPFNMDYDDPAQNLHIHQKKGYRLLDGQDAMEVIRFRKNNDGSHSLGDVGRTEIQRDFLTAVLKKCLTPEILLKLPSLVQIFTENVETDLTVGNILAFAQLAIGMDAEKGVTFSAMPYYGVWYDGASLVCVDQDKMVKLLNSGLNPYVDDIKASDLQLMYQKSGGGFGVTNATLADPAVAQVYVAPKPKPEEPDSSEEPGDTSGEENPDTSTPPDSSGEDTPPDSSQGNGDSSGSGDTSIPGDTGAPGDTSGSGSQSGEAQPPAGLGVIDPSLIFPDPSPDIQNGNGQIAADGLNIPPQAAA